MFRNSLLIRTLVAALCCVTLFLPLTLGIQGIIATIAQFYSGWHFYFRARKGLNRDTLVALAITAAYLYSFYLIFTNQFRGIYFETSTFLIAFILIGRIIEEQYKLRADSHINTLEALQTDKVKQKGDVFVVQPDETIPADGQIEKGKTIVDETILTGSGIAVEKGIGSPIYAGTTNLHGTIICQATKSSSETVLSNIIRLIKNTGQTKTATQRIADKTASFLIPLTLTIALFTWIGWGFSAQGIIYAISVLLIASPQAFRLAATLTLTLACSKAASKGIFIKDAKALELARKIKRIIIDKNSIITEEILSVEKTTIQESYFPIVKTLCEHSDHPACKGILEYLEQRKVPSISTMMVFRTTPRQGVNGYFDERKYYFGSLSYLEKEKVPIEKFKEEITIALGTEKLFLGYFILSDRIKVDSKESIETLKQLGIQTVLISSDQKIQTQRTAAALKFNSFETDILPQDKVKFVEMAKREGKVVAMIGNGNSDAPALAAADISYAVGSGTDIPMQSASIGLMRSDLTGVIETIALSQLAFQRTSQNLLFALSYHIIAIPLAACGFIHPIIAGAAMALSSALIAFNALRDTKKTTKINNELVSLEHERSVD